MKITPIIKVIMKAIDLKKPLVFNHFINSEVAVKHIEKYMKDSFTNYSLEWHIENKKYIYKVFDYGVEAPYWIKFKLKTIKVIT